MARRRSDKKRLMRDTGRSCIDLCLVIGGVSDYGFEEAKDKLKIVWYSKGDVSKAE